MSLTVLATLVGFLAATTCVFGQEVEKTNLELYVEKIDDVYKWELIATYDNYRNFTAHVLNVTSQRWLDETYVDKYIWWHYAVVTLPQNETKIQDQALLLYIGGNGNDNDPPPELDEIVILCGEAAYFLSAVVVCLNQIPNAPIHYTADPENQGRGGDPSIAWSWRQWTMIDNMTSPVELLLYFPMVKGGVRTVDAVQEFIRLEYNYELTKWVVGGPSKWGWTSWLHGAVDKRVVGLVPIVMNLLNNEPCMGSMHMQLHGWSWAMVDYWENDITTLWGNTLDQLNINQDPYRFRHLMNMPKLIIQGTDDEYFLPDNHWYWLNDMPGHNMVWMLENTDHIIIGHWARTLVNVYSFFKGLHTGFKFPNPKWTRGDTRDSGWITLYSLTQPKEIVGWRANISHPSHKDVLRRDFRWFRLPYEDEPSDNPNEPVFTGIRWHQTEVLPVAGQPDTWKLELPAPRIGEGWEGIFIAMTYDGPEGPDGPDIYLSTEVHIFPDHYTGELCDPRESCKSVLA